MKKTSASLDAHHIDIADLLKRSGGSYARTLGIKLTKTPPLEVYKWFIAAILYGTRISEDIATHAWHEFERNNMLTPDRMINAGWNKLVKILDEGKYVRYDYKTATKLLDVNHTLLDQYEGNLNNLHKAAADAADLERRIMALGKGIGRVTAAIFLRELRGRWKKANPPLSPLAISAARKLGYLPNRIRTNVQSLTHLQHLWQEHGKAATRFPEFEAALVREGLRLRRQGNSHNHHEN